MFLTPKVEMHSAWYDIPCDHLSFSSNTLDTLLFPLLSCHHSDIVSWRETQDRLLSAGCLYLRHGWKCMVCTPGSSRVRISGSTCIMGHPHSSTACGWFQRQPIATYQWLRYSWLYILTKTSSCESWDLADRMVLQTELFGHIRWPACTTAYQPRASHTRSEECH